MNSISVKNLCKTYGKGEMSVDALKNVSFDIKHGEFAAVIGPSGSGKSTLLNLLGALDYPTSGQILINKKDITGMKEEELAVFRRRHIGFVFQSFNLVPELNVIENIIFPLLLDGKKPDMGYIDGLVDHLGLSQRKHHLPNQLSGGQQQRVAIGRALAAKPELILADEPTGNLDTKSSNDVMKLLRSFVDIYNQTLVMITHNQAFAQFSDRVLYVEDGIVLDRGREVS